MVDYLMVIIPARILLYPHLWEELYFMSVIFQGQTPLFPRIFGHEAAGYSFLLVHGTSSFHWIVFNSYGAYVIAEKKKRSKFFLNLT